MKQPNEAEKSEADNIKQCDAIGDPCRTLGPNILGDSCCRPACVCVPGLYWGKYYWYFVECTREIISVCILLMRSNILTDSLVACVKIEWWMVDPATWTYTMNVCIPLSMKKNLSKNYTRYHFKPFYHYCLLFFIFKTKNLRYLLPNLK